MRFTVITVGRPRDRALLSLCEDYIRRIERHGRCQWHALREGQGAGPDQVRAQEAERILAHTPPRAVRVALDERGVLWTSTQLAGHIDQACNRAEADWVLWIGGAEGLHPDLRARAERVWSLSPLTLPHELALVVTLEQLYRAGTILRGEPYHRGG
jgi:23S rRNA (pseudouridine1915-N3)-methyltransferase